MLVLVVRTLFGSFDSLLVKGAEAMAICVICQRDCPSSLLTVSGVCPSCVSASLSQLPVRESELPFAEVVGEEQTGQEEVCIGCAVVREVFKIGRVGTIADCLVTAGKLVRPAQVRVVREGIVVFPAHAGGASLTALKQFQDDVLEVGPGMACGLKIDGCDDLRVGDLIEARVVGLG